ncbi:MAG: 23S rRNA (adenine(2030)-N(6))-methyltransferase RlmJ, partial [Treponema sp.]|nr:23S rRNA (adenine(2030)-N(6))-methyltransferase RlmJ [Treponema sp.]
MLSYRHVFHAGNVADVLKHAILVFCLEYLGKKEKPYLLADTHAGAGVYALTGGCAAGRGEWEGGIGRLLPLEGLPALLEDYRGLAAQAMPEFRGLAAGAGDSPGYSGPPVYPGSPALMAKYLRPGDRLLCFELHPADYASLRTF